MKRVFRFIVGVGVVLLIFLVLAIWALFFSARPPLTIDPATLKGNGSGKRAADITKGNTPGCSYDHFPLPVLADCLEPFSERADDIRGLWIGVEWRAR